MLNDKTYNGWTNQITWLVNLWYGDLLADIAQEQAMDADIAEDIVWQYLDSDTRNVSFASDLLRLAMANVDWQEIANAANE